MDEHEFKEFLSSFRYDEKDKHFIFYMYKTKNDTV